MPDGGGLQVSGLTYNLVMGLGLLKIKNVSLPNLLAERELVPEFMQARANADELGPAVLKLLDDTLPATRSCGGLQRPRACCGSVPMPAPQKRYWRWPTPAPRAGVECPGERMATRGSDRRA